MKIVFTLLTLLFSLSSFAQLRNTSWGMKAQEVKNIETSKLIFEIQGDLTYDIDIDDLNCELKYVFANNKLIEIRYSFRPIVQERSIVNPTAVWEKTIKNIKEKYGLPTNRNNDNLYIWSLKDFTIKASNISRSANEQVFVSYTPPLPTQKDIL